MNHRHIASTGLNPNQAELQNSTIRWQWLSQRCIITISTFQIRHIVFLRWSLGLSSSTIASELEVVMTLTLGNLDNT